MANEQNNAPAGLPGQARALWGRLPMARRAMVIGAVVAIIALVAWTTLRPTGGRWSVLFAKMSAEDAGEVVGLLQARGIPYQIAEGGATVQVAPEKVHEVRMMAAAAGLPHGGVGFEVFDGRSFGQSSFVEQVNYRRALQGELARSISALSAVESARVHIAMGKRSVFRDSDEPPTASVALRLSPGATLDRDQVRGIVHLVAASIDGLAAEHVSVIDQNGNVLSKDDGDIDGAEEGATVEQGVVARVRSILERVVGAGRVAVVATAQMDRRQVDSTEEAYDKDNTALRSEARTIEGSGELGGIGGIAGAQANLPGAPAPTTTGGGPGMQRLQETKNYEINRVVKHIVEPAVRVGRMHVAVLVDYYARGADGAPVARDAGQLDQLAVLARQAAGIDTERGDTIEVKSVPFVDQVEDAVEAEPEAAASDWPLPVSLPVLIAAAGGLLLFGIVAFLMLRARRRRKAGGQVIALPARVHEMQAALDEPGARRGLGAGAGATPTLALAERTVNERVLETVRADTQHAARVLSAWLAEAKVAEPKGNKAA